MTHETLTVALGERSYSIVIGSGVLEKAGEELASVLPSNRVIVVSDNHVAPLYSARLKQALGRVRSDWITVEAGEGAKSFASLEGLLNQLLALQPDRKTTLIALGGGVVGDLTGFAASILLRGVPFVQIPTSLLAQVDSAVGGKTAINAATGKNLIGSFHQPVRVLSDVALLRTLPPRELRAGYAEIVKYGLIVNAEFYRWCVKNGKAMLSGDEARLTRAVRECCRMKAEIVGADERESGRRALLNFGHTFAHALEAELGYDGRLLHGEAVSIGMVMACRLSAKLGLIDSEVEQELTAHLAAMELPISPAQVAAPWNADRIAAHFVADKKAEQGRLTFVLLERIGAGRVIKAVEPVLAHDVVASFL